MSSSSLETKTWQTCWVVDDEWPSTHFMWFTGGSSWQWGMMRRKNDGTTGRQWWGTMEKQQWVTMGRWWGNNREMTGKWQGGMMGNDEDGQGNNKQDGTTTNGQHSCPMPMPHYHYPQAHSHPGKAQMPATTVWALGIFSFCSFFFFFAY
jgi:hypothetical protein